jgi:hypothetical protein
MSVRKQSIKYIIIFELHFIGYLYITELTIARKMENIKEYNINIFP